MANDHKNNELQQSRDVNSPSENSGAQAISETNLRDESDVVMATAPTTALPEFGLGLKIDSNGNNQNRVTTTIQEEARSILTSVPAIAQASGIVTCGMSGTVTTSAAATQNSTTISFKHLLGAAPSTAMTSLEPICSPVASGTTSTAAATQKSTGARPKVPQCRSSTLNTGLTAPGCGDCSGGSFGIGSIKRNKRSAQLSSFDSQANLAEFVATDSLIGDSNHSNRSSLQPTLPYAAPQHGLDAGQHLLGAAASTDMDRNTDNGSNILGLSDLPPATASTTTALPDFVQDHWMATLSLNDIPLNSTRDEFDGALATGTVANVAWRDLGANSIGAGDCGGIGCGSVDSAHTSRAWKKLPDFLSDGSILHSSQHLTDVAAGLSPNSFGSLKEPSAASQLSNLRQKNDRLQRELNELRIALCAQTRRNNDLERQIEEENRCRTSTPTAQQMQRLKQQLAWVTEELEILRRENEILRAEGAVGGLPEAGNAGAGPRNDGGFAQPISAARSHQISQALLRAAANAEDNLRQLLAGFDNLRQLAADIEGPGLRLDDDGNSDISSDFLDDDCDGFENFRGGSAL